MASGTPIISVLVVAYNSGAHLPRCLAAVEAQTCRDFELLVLDNGSTDGSVIDLSAMTVPARLERSAENLGFAAGNNRLAGTANGKWLALLNPDAFPEPDWLEAVMKATAQYPGVSVFGSTQLLDEAPELLDGAGDHYSPLGLAWRGDRMKPASIMTQDGEVMGPCAAAGIYRRDAFRAVGGFAESFFCYYEDVDLGLRLRLAGERCIQLAGARVRHVASAITGQNSDFSRYHITRNRIWTFLRCMPFPVFQLVLPLLLAQLTLIVVLGPVRGDGPVRRRAIRDAFVNFRTVMKQRAEIQGNRKASLRAFLGALSWNPAKLFGAKGDRRPIRRENKAGAVPPTGVEHAAD
ncbi:glycosyltransferase family 2 protein [Nisaea acidiphila]|uniref:Glycosyltransferase family 2 protein n=1 Tax=Nisaea acidiphila TaxID=1862145 RepID=A0A9J7AMX4_9PROT|nr:glycosyltransferase family 2 protein [Nisaea acidiphila]UUX48306.1 glycosyltransferase family 2 protein [Nisaea acidiphila]